MKEEKKPDWLISKFPLASKGYFGEEIQVLKDTFSKEKKSEKRILCFNKYWLEKDGYSNRTYRIKDQEKWEKIRETVEKQAFPVLGWQQSATVLKELEKEQQQKKKIETRVTSLIENNPSMINKLLENLDFTFLNEQNVSFIVDLIRNLDKKILEAEQNARNSFSSIVKNISSSNTKGLDELNSLLQKWNLLQLASISTILARRLNTLDIFLEMVHEENTYELQGDNSIHRVLERNMWILNERYWLMQSNQSLRTFIGDEIMRKDKGMASKRPDFVCCTKDNRLIIVEIKRPSLIIGKKEIDQIEKYTLVAEDYKSKDFNKIEAYLVGKKMNEEGKKLIKHRTDIKFKTYDDLIEETKYVYEEYLKKLEEIKNEQYISDNNSLLKRPAKA